MSKKGLSRGRRISKNRNTNTKPVEGLSKVRKTQQQKHRRKVYRTRLPSGPPDTTDHQHLALKTTSLQQISTLPTPGQVPLQILILARFRYIFPEVETINHHSMLNWLCLLLWVWSRTDYSIYHVLWPPDQEPGQTQQTHLPWEGCPGSIP